MPTVAKDVLYPGVYTLPDGSKFECSPGDVRNACVVGNRLLDLAQLSPPLIWEHDWETVAEAVPRLLSELGKSREWRAGFARNCFGYADRFTVESVGGEPVLWTENAVPDAGEARRWERCRFVSPRVDYDRRSSDGRFWPGLSVQHIAATPVPVQGRQMPVMLSQGVGPGRSRRTAFLSRSYLLGGPPMADDATKLGGGLGGIVSELANLGINIPDGVNTPEDLVLALKAIGANRNGPAAPSADDLGGAYDGDSAAGAEPAVTPAMLSTIAKRSGTDSLLSRLKRIEKRAVELFALTVPEVEAIERELKGMDAAAMLSVMAGTRKSRAVERLEWAERVVAGKAPPGPKPGAGGKDGLPSVSLSELTPVSPPPLPTRGVVSEDEAKRAADEARARVAKQAPPAAPAK